jgi:acetylornithine/succinyldiaminopimelate/putrescine aminotransferase
VTNLIYFDVGPVTAEEMISKLATSGVLMIATAPNTIRAVTSLEVDSEDIDKAISVIRDTASGF